MINYTFGPSPEGIQPVVDIAAAQNDTALAQSIYDSRSSGFYGAIDLVGISDPLQPDELIAAQHVFWDPALERLRGQGLVLDRGHTPKSIRQLGDLYIQHCRQAQDIVDTPEAESAIEQASRALNMGQVATFAAWELSRRPNRPDVIRLVYPRLLFDHSAGPELARTKHAEDMPTESLDLSVQRAILASAIAYKHSLAG